MSIGHGCSERIDSRSSNSRHDVGVVRNPDKHTWCFGECYIFRRTKLLRIGTVYEVKVHLTENIDIFSFHFL